METHRLSFLSEPTGEVYEALIDQAAREGLTAILVVRAEPRHSSEGEVALERLKKHLRSKYQASEWPGTRQLGSASKPWVYEYELGPGCVQGLKAIANRLYKWDSPDFPMDLSFVRRDGRPWLTTTAHEDHAHLDLTEEEEARLLKLIPDLRSLTRLVVGLEPFRE
jgi:hypothetical protein